MIRPRSASKNPLTVPLTLVTLLLVAGASFWLGRSAAQRELEEIRGAYEALLAEVEGREEEEEAVAAADAAAAEPEAAPIALAPPATDAQAAPSTPPAPAAVAKAAPPSAEGDGLHHISVEIKGSITRTLLRALGREVGDPLSQVTGRLLVWWLDVSRDLRRGDALHLVYELPEGKEPTIHALSFTSQKLNQTFHAYRYQPPGAEFARYYDREGKEVELRLEHPPMERYEQITSLLKDGRGHAGVDFKAPEGIPVLSPWAGKVTRVNFNTRVNGRCVEIEDSKGRRALYLHLAEVAEEMKPGAKVRRGQQVGLSGNTGRSTAPHLHYQLMSRGGRVLDPFEEHNSFRVSLEPGQLAGFQAAVARYDSRLQLVASASDGP